MNTKILKRQLTDKELNIFIQEVKKFFSPIVGYKDKWRNFDTFYIATNKDEVIGIF